MMTSESSEPSSSAPQTQTAYFAAGCFWGVEHLFQQLPGVLSAESGYMGGHTPNPTYEAVCQKQTGHLETVAVHYDPNTIPYRKLVQFFFEIHDFEQSNGQGPDIGPQYLSAIFYQTEDEKQVIDEYLIELKNRGFKPVTSIRKVRPDTPFYPAEPYHQDYYQKTGRVPYCHQWKPIFND